jgi:mRNA interferase MazF
MAYARFSILRVPFPFTDRQSQKQRPALVISDPSFQQASGHLLLAMVTSAAHSAWPLDWPIQKLESTGLKHACLVRLKLFTLDERLCLNQVGELSDVDSTGVCQRLEALLPQRA